MTPLNLRKRIVVLLLALVAPTAQAGIAFSHIDVDDGNTQAMLRASNQYYLDAMGEIAKDGYPGLHNKDTWKALLNQMDRQTVARIEYTYVMDGIEQARIYHAVSGPPLGFIAKRVFDPTGPNTPRGSGSTPSTPTSPGTPGTPGTPSTPTMDASAPNRTYPIFEQSDETYYRFNENNVRGVVLPNDTTVIHPYTVEGAPRGGDAEIKAIRSLERDINSGTVSGGGSIRAYVSKSTCASCREAFDILASHYEVSGHVTQMRESLPDPVQNELIDRGLAQAGPNQVLYTVRDGVRAPYLASRSLQEERRSALKDLISSLKTERKDLFRLGSVRRAFNRPWLQPRYPDTPQEPRPGPSRPPGC